MVSLSNRHLGLLLIGFSLLLVIFLSFLKSDMDKKDTFTCEMVHENPSLDMSQCPVHTSNTSWFLTAAFAFGFLLMGIGLYMLFGQEKKENVGKQEIVEKQFLNVDKLDEEERKVYDLLKIHDGSLYQSDIVKETRFSKVRTTRILDKLESKKIIERKRRGMTNIIILR